MNKLSEKLHAVIMQMCSYYHQQPKNNKWVVSRIIAKNSILHKRWFIAFLNFPLKYSWFSFSGLSQHESDQIRKYFLNPPTVPTPRIVNKGKDLSVRLGQSIKIPCEIINKGNIFVKSL